MPQLRFRRIFAALLLACPVAAGAASATVAVAANFGAAMQELSAAFEAASGHRVELAPGSSGKLYAQIRHGAPFAAYFSADRDKPAALLEQGLAVPGSGFTYAVGALVLWSADPEAVDAGGLVLKQARFERLALANPRLAPYGAAAVEVLRALGLEHTRERWVLGENVAQAWQFVHSGNARLGLVALSQMVQAGPAASGSAWRVPSWLHAPIRQDAVLLERGRDNAAARALLDFVASARGRAIIERHGYRTHAP